MSPDEHLKSELLPNYMISNGTGESETSAESHLTCGWALAPTATSDPWLTSADLWWPMRGAGRYPTFSDALNDLDDPMSLCCLFAIMPTVSKLSDCESTSYLPCTPGRIIDIIHTDSEECGMLSNVFWTLISLSCWHVTQYVCFVGLITHLVPLTNNFIIMIVCDT